MLRAVGIIAEPKLKSNLVSGTIEHNPLRRKFVPTNRIGGSGHGRSTGVQHTP